MRHSSLFHLLVALAVGIAPVLAAPYPDGGGVGGIEDQDFEAADNGADDYDDEEDMGSAYKKPNFTSVAQHFRVRLGDAVRLPCDVDELGPGYTLLWKREEGDILTAGSVLIVKDSRISHEGASLVVRNITMADQGAYICQISTQDQRELRHIIEILVPPSVKTVPSTGLMVVKKGEPVSLACEVTGNPLPVVTWTREGGKKFPDGQKTMLGNTITFVETNRHHAGVYTCTAENSEGSPAKGVINLEITYEPEVEVEQSLVSLAEGFNAELTCTVHGEPKPTVSWYKDGERLDGAGDGHRLSQSTSGSRHVLAIDNVNTDDFANYTCAGENRFGRQEKTIELTGAASVAVIKRKKALANGVELEWTTVSYSPIAEYRVRYRKQSAPQWEELILKAKEQDKPSDSLVHNHVHQLHGLVAGTEYELAIESMNKFGWSRSLVDKFETLPQIVDAATQTGSASRATWSSLYATIVTALVTVALL